MNYGPSHLDRIDIQKKLPIYTNHIEKYKYDNEEYKYDIKTCKNTNPAH